MSATTVAFIQRNFTDRFTDEIEKLDDFDDSLKGSLIQAIVKLRLPGSVTEPQIDKQSFDIIVGVVGFSFVLSGEVVTLSFVPIKNSRQGYLRLTKS